MKTVVSVQEIAELEIKPTREVAEWRALVEREIASRWSDRSGWVAAGCPCCGAAPPRDAFERLGVAYGECRECGSLFAVRRPVESAITAWYRDSAPAKFWRERLLTVSQEARLEKLIRPRAQWVLDAVAEYTPEASRLVDVSSSGRALLDELAAQAPQFTSISAASATADLDGTSSGAITVEPSSVKDLSALKPTRVLTALDALDRAADVPALVEASHRVLEPGGILLATLPVASGFEVQALWEQSPTVVPPDKLNLPSIQGLMRLFGSPRWELLELSTPGMFDVEIVRRAMVEHVDAPWPRLLRSLLGQADAPARAMLTEYLQSQRLTSFARLIARRRT